jgi:hypothetical protein
VTRYPVPRAFQHYLSRLTKYFHFRLWHPLPQNSLCGLHGAPLSKHPQRRSALLQPQRLLPFPFLENPLFFLEFLDA